MVARFQQIYRVHQIYRGFIAALSWNPLGTMPVQGAKIEPLVLHRATSCVTSQRGAMVSKGLQQRT